MRFFSLSPAPAYLHLRSLEARDDRLLSHCTVRSVRWAMDSKSCSEVIARMKLLVRIRKCCKHLVRCFTHKKRRKADVDEGSPAVAPEVLLPRLPPELCDRIIDFLYNSPRALSACCLTCRSWVPASRFHRFRSIFLTPFRAERFLHILETNPDTAYYVETVVVHFQGRDPTATLLELQEGSAETLRRVFEQLHAVTSLMITRLFITPKMTDLFSVLAASVKSLDLVDILIGDPISLDTMISAFPSLEKIVTADKMVLDVTTSGRSTVVLPSSIRTLRLNFPYGPHAFPMSSWLHSKNLTQHVRKLIVDVPTPLIQRRLDTITKVSFALLFDTFGPALETLELNMPQSLRLSDIPFTFKHCTSLRHITFHATPDWFCPVHAAANPFPTWAPLFLSRIEVDCVRTIAFALRLPDTPEPRDLHCIEELALPLARPQFRALERVTFRVSGERLEKELLAFVKKEIPELHDRGIVGVEVERSMPPLLVSPLLSSQRGGRLFAGFGP